MMQRQAAHTAASDAQREWFTAAELADLALPGLPADKRSLNRRARHERWAARIGADGAPLARPRGGRGGGLEFHLSLLPGQTRIELARRGITAESPMQEVTETPSEAAWRWLGQQNTKTKAEAERRLAIVGEVDLLCQAGQTKSSAVAAIASIHTVGKATLWNWLDMIKGTPRHDWLPALAPRRQGGGREAEIDAELWQLFKSDYLRQSAPTLSICYAKVAEVARLRGVSIPSEAAFRRKAKREIDPDVLLLARKGPEALRRAQPAQRRTVAELHALEVVNMDGHKFDVFVIPPQGGKPTRPIMIGIQDVYSRKLLAWRIGTSETAWMTRLVFADLFGNFGIPGYVHFDNGRAFASKWITGGKKFGRFRFTDKDTDPAGLLTTLGIGSSFTLPYRGQSKPIERAWRDLCDSIARCAAFEGAYTGNNTVNKPENHGKTAVPWDVFVAEVERGIAFHNARFGRRTEIAKGRSFDVAFAESYARAPISQASEHHLRTALMMGENVRVNKQTGEIALFGNRYYSPGWAHLRGELVTVRFDPDNLHRELHLFDLAGKYLTAFALYGDVGFHDIEGAKAAGRMVAEVKKQTKALLEAEQLLTAAQVALVQSGNRAPAPQLPAPGATRIVRQRGNQAVALADLPEPALPEPKDNLISLFGRVKPLD